MWPTPLSLPKVLYFSLRYYHVLVHGAICAVCEHALLAAARERLMANDAPQMGSPNITPQKSAKRLSFDKAVSALNRIWTPAHYYSPYLCLVVSSIMVMIASEGEA